MLVLPDVALLLVDGAGDGYLKAILRLRSPEHGVSQNRSSNARLSNGIPGEVGRNNERRPPNILYGYGWIDCWATTRHPRDGPAGRRNLEERRACRQADDHESIRRGWCLGEKVFTEKLSLKMDERMVAEHYGEERTESEGIKAESIVREELKKRRWKESDLKERLKGDVENVKIAKHLRAETVRSVEWIARRLQPGSRNWPNYLLWKAGARKR